MYLSQTYRQFVTTPLGLHKKWEYMRPDKEPRPCSLNQLKQNGGLRGTKENAWGEGDMCKGEPPHLGTGTVGMEQAAELDTPHNIDFQFHLYSL